MDQKPWLAKMVEMCIHVCLTYYKHVFIWYMLNDDAKCILSMYFFTYDNSSITTSFKMLGIEYDDHDIHALTRWSFKRFLKFNI